MQYWALLLLVAAAQTARSPTISLFGRVELPSKTGAACLDGTPYSYYIWEPEPEDKPANKVLIYFEETAFGWCVKEDLASSLDECYKFLADENLADYSSSKNWPSDFLPLTGIMSPFDGGEFNMWIKVLIKSCDAGAHMGNREPIPYKKHKFNIKGSVNVEQSFKSLSNKKIFAGKQEIVLAGSLNGAVGLVNSLDVLKKYTGATPVRLLLDTAIHLDVPNKKTNRSELQNRMKMLQKLFLNDQPTQLKACSQAHPLQQWKCLFPQEAQKFISQSIFWSQSLYDGWSIAEVLGFKCAEQFASLSECEKSERQAIEEYHKNVTEIFTSLAKKEGNGGFGIACVAHEFVAGRWNNQMFEVPMNSGNSASNATSSWLNKKKQVVFLDSDDWPLNKPCSRKVVVSLTSE